MADRGRLGTKHGKGSRKQSSRDRARVEKALAKARAQLVKRRRQVEEALALVASLEVQAAMVGEMAPSPAAATTSGLAGAPATARKPSRPGAAQPPGSSATTAKRRSTRPGRTGLSPSEG